MQKKLENRMDDEKRDIILIYDKIRLKQISKC